MDKDDVRFWIVVILAVVLFAGDPDIVDGVTYYLMN